MSVDELIGAYQDIIKKPIDTLQTNMNESRESVDILLQTSSARILVVRNLTNPASVTLEVEIWLPNPGPNAPPSEARSAKAIPQNKVLSTMLTSMIDHLQYLQKLSEKIQWPQFYYRFCKYLGFCPNRHLFGL